MLFLNGFQNGLSIQKQYSRPHIIISILVSFFFFTLVAPIVEELYFRGYLLDRMRWMGNYGVILNVFLFAVYHFCSPWLIIARTVALMPLFYFVY
ncbi:MAG: CPBP family intramembrane glutamic endopeptidase, partial [Eubacteriales bacterium]